MLSAARMSLPPTSTSLSLIDTPSGNGTYLMSYTGNPRKKCTKSISSENLLAVRNDATFENLSNSPGKCASLLSTPQPLPLPSSLLQLLLSSSTTTKIPNIDASMLPTASTSSLANVTGSSSSIYYASTSATTTASNSRVRPLTSAAVSGSNSLTGRLSTSMTKNASNSPIDPTTTSVIVSATGSLPETTVYTLNSFITRPSTSANARASKYPDVRPSRDSTSPASSLLGFKRPLSSSYSYPLKQPTSDAIVDSETKNNTESINRSGSVSAIRPHVVSKLFHPFGNLIEPVSLREREGTIHQTDQDIRLFLARRCVPESSRSLQAESDISMKYPENIVFSSTLDEFADPAWNFHPKHETESPSGNEISTFQATSNLAGEHGVSIGNPVTEALDAVHYCAFMAVRNVQRRSEFSEYTNGKGNDADKIFANEANNLLKSLPKNIAIECKGFVLQFLEVLEFSASNGLLKD